jgi:hypothetical protein
MVGVATAAGSITDTNWREAARRAGISDEQIAAMQRATQPAMADATAVQESVPTKEEVSESATQAAWWTLGGTLLSMLAAIGGAILGAGGKFELLALGVARGERSHRHVGPSGPMKPAAQ